MAITIYKKAGQHAIVKHSDGKHFAYVMLKDSQVQAPDYSKKGSGFYVSNGFSDSAIHYVAQWVSLTTARKRMNEAMGI